MKTKTGEVTSLNQKKPENLALQNAVLVIYFPAIKRIALCQSASVHVYVILWFQKRLSLAIALRFRPRRERGVRAPPQRGCALQQLIQRACCGCSGGPGSQGSLSRGLHLLSFPALLFKRALIFSEKRPLVCSSVRPIYFDLSLRNRMMRDKSSKYKKKLNMQRM